MKHVIALDISKGKSTIAIYDGYKHCEFEGELYHTLVDFEKLHKRIEEITILDGQTPKIDRCLFKMCRKVSTRLQSYILPFESA